VSDPRDPAGAPPIWRACRWTAATFRGPTAAIALVVWPVTFFAWSLGWEPGRGYAVAAGVVAATPVLVCVALLGLHWLTSRCKRGGRP